MSIDRIAVTALRERGSGLHRPECVLGSPSGDLYVSDWRGGITVVRADGSQRSWLALDCPVELRPNGIGFDAQGRFLIANLGDGGGVWRMDATGATEPVIVRLDGRSFPPANFVYMDQEQRIWITVSTRHSPRQAAWRTGVRDGFVVCIDAHGARIVADGLHYTNEARVDPTGCWLYVVETFGQRLIRYPIGKMALGRAELVAQLGDGFFPDGFAFDAEGGLLLTSLVSNRIAHIDRDGGQRLVLEENLADHTSAMQAAFDRDEMPADGLGPIPGTRLQHVTSVAFGGPDATTLALGCLHNDRVFTIDVAVAGAPPPHWDVDLP